MYDLFRVFFAKAVDAVFLSAAAQTEHVDPGGPDRVGYATGTYCLLLAAMYVIENVATAGTPPAEAQSRQGCFRVQGLGFVLRLLLTLLLLGLQDVVCVFSYCAQSAMLMFLCSRSFKLTHG